MCSSRRSAAVPGEAPISLIILSRQKGVNLVKSSRAFYVDTVSLVGISEEFYRRNMN